MNKRTKCMLAMMSGKSKLCKVSGLPPLTYTAENMRRLNNYRIYGNTVSGESVGDRTGNLFDENYNRNIEDNTIVYMPLKVGEGVFTLSTSTPKSDNANYLFFLSGNADSGASNNSNGISNLQSRTVTSSNGYVTIAYRKINRFNIMPWDYHTMLNTGSEPLPYEPYGYRVPVTVTNGTDTQTINLYLLDQIRKVGDEAEYIDFMEQKQHFADGTSVDVTLPALPTLPGTNVLSVETEVQPSSVEIEGRIKPVVTGGG